MTVTEVAAALQVHRSLLYRYPQVLARLKARTPLGKRKYAAVLVERLKQDQSLVQLGRRA